MNLIRERLRIYTAVLEKTLESPLDCKKIQPVHPREISPGGSLDGLMLKLKLQHFGHLTWRVDSLEKTLMLGGIGGRRWREQQRMRWHHWLDGHEFGWTPGAGDGQGGLACCKPWGRKESDSNKQLNWTDEDKSCSLPEGSQVDSKKQRQEPNKNQETGPRKILDLSPFIYALQPTLAKR